MAYLISFIGVYFIIYGFRIGYPVTLYGDEIHQIVTAKQFLTLSGYHEMHPPFGMILQAMSIFLFGDHPIAWRLISFLSGAGIIILLYLIALQLFKERRMAFFAVFICFFDCISFAQARIGTIHSTMLFFMLLSIYFAFLSTRDDPNKRRVYLALSGVSFGLSFATRWISASVLVVIAMILIRYQNENKKPARNIAKEFIIYFLLTPVAVYFTTYIFVPFIQGNDWSSIIKHQWAMLERHTTLRCEHRYQSEFWQWPLLQRPIWFYYFVQNKSTPQEIFDGIICIGNPAVFWSIPIIFAYAIYLFIKKKKFEYGLILCGFFTQWLQWALIWRTKYFQYFYTSMPFVCMGFAVLLDRLWKKKGPLGKLAVFVYLLGVVGLFIYWYPLMTDMPVSGEVWRNHQWLKSWF